MTILGNSISWDKEQTGCKFEEATQKVFLLDKIAIVTGGGSGIGEAIAKAFGQEGANIVVADINFELAKKVSEEVEGIGRKGLAIKMDVALKDDVDRLVDEAIKTFGRIDILINNAGITQPPLSVLELDIESWERVTNVLYKGVYFCSRKVGQGMVKQRSGSIINISSIGGLISHPLVAYSTAKSAVIHLTKILAAEWGRFNVRVNSIAPGYTLTPLIKGAIERGERDPQMILRRTPMGRMVEPEDIAHAALFLASDRARYITGITLPVDAGFLALSTLFDTINVAPTYDQ